MILPKSRTNAEIHDVSEALEKLAVLDTSTKSENMGESLDVVLPPESHKGPDEGVIAGSLDSESRDQNQVLDDSDQLYLSSLINTEQHHWLHERPTLGLIRFTLSESVFIKGSPILTVYAPIRQFPIRRASRTASILYRGSSLPVVQALSGWSHKEDKFTSCISGRLWTEQVFVAADLIGFTLTPDVNDHGRPGWFNASHAEKQAVAYTLWYHTSFKNEWAKSITKNLIKSTMATTRSLKNGIITPEKHQENVKYIREVTSEIESLRDELQSQREVPLKQVDIMINRKTQCTDCKAFIAAVEAFFNLRIIVHECSTYPDHKRPIETGL